MDFFFLKIVNCYGLNGMGAQAIEVFRRMPQELTDEVTYICILNACSHSGLVDEARLIFENVPIKTEYINSTMVWEKYCLENFEELSIY